MWRNALEIEFPPVNIGARKKALLNWEFKAARRPGITRTKARKLCS